MAMELVRSAPGVRAMSSRTDERGGGDGVDVGGVEVGGDSDGLLEGADLEFEVEDGRGVGGEGDGLLCGCEAGFGDGDDVVTEGDGGKREGAIQPGVRGFDEGRVGGADFDLGAGDGPVLRVVYDSVDLAEDSRVGRSAG